MNRSKSHHDRRATILPIARTMRREKLSIAEIAKRTGVPRGTISSWLSRDDPAFPAPAPAATNEDIRTNIARLDRIFLEAMQAWESSKPGKTEETTSTADETEAPRVRAANRRASPASHGNPAYLQAAIRALESSNRARAVLAGRPPAGEFDRLMLVSEEVFVRRVREMSDDELAVLQATVSQRAPAVIVPPR